MAGNMPTSDKTEYLPPIYSLCFIRRIFFFLAKLNKALFLFSVITIVFFLVKFKFFKILILVNVSIVFPDLEIKINKNLLEFFFYQFYLFCHYLNYPKK